MAENKNIQVNISTGTIWRVVLFGLLLYVLWLLRDFVLVIITSIVVASFMEAVIRKLGKYGKYRVPIVVLIYLSGIAVFGLIFYAFVPILISEFANVIGLISDFIPESDLITRIQEGGFSQAQEVVRSFAGDSSFGSVAASTKELISNVSGRFFQTLSTVFGGVVNLVLIVIISFYLSIQEKGISNFLRIVTPQKHEEYVISLWTRSQKKIAYWIQGQFLLALIVGVLTYLGLSILGLEYALLIAVIAAVFELIPFGMILAAVPAISFAYLQGGPSLMLLVAGFYIIVQQFENYLLVPLVIRRVVGISPLVVILSILIGAQLAGFWGILLAIPVAVPFVEFMDDLQKKKIAAKAK